MESAANLDKMRPSKEGKRQTAKEVRDGKEDGNARGVRVVAKVYHLAHGRGERLDRLAVNVEHADVPVSWNQPSPSLEFLARHSPDVTQQQVHLAEGFQTLAVALCPLGFPQHERPQHERSEELASARRNGREVDELGRWECEDGLGREMRLFINRSLEQRGDEKQSWRDEGQLSARPPRSRSEDSLGVS